MKKRTYLSMIVFFLFAVWGTCSAVANEAVNSGILIEDAVICEDISERNPVAPGDIFTSDIEQLFCFTRVVGVEGESEVIHNWYLNDTLASSVTLSVRSSNWRTYSSKTIMPEFSGNWRVEILSAEKELLKQIHFIIE